MKGSANFMTTNSLSGIDAGLVSHRPKYDNPFTTYLVFTSDADQNLISNLSNLFGMYCINLHLVFVRKSCSSMLRSAPGL